MRKPAAFSLLLLLISAAAMAEETRVVRKQVDLRPDGRVSIDTFKGTVRVRTWDQPRVDVVAKIAPDPSGDKQQERVELTEIRISSSSGHVDIESDYSDASRVREGFFGAFFGVTGGTMPFVHYEITMPATASLEIEDHKSDIQVGGLSGDLAIETHKGTAKVTSHAGGVRVETHKGDIDIDYASLSRPARIETHKGSVTLRIPAAARFDVAADLDDDSADFSSEFQMPVEREEDSASVRARVNGGGPTIRIETHKGSIRIVKK